VPLGRREDGRRAVQPGERRLVRLRAPVEGEEPVRLPERVGKLGHDVAGELGAAADLRDLEGERGELVALGRLGEGVRVGPHPVEPGGVEALDETLRAGDAVAGPEPPRGAVGEGRTACG
jgi:hypothetical protein